MADRRKGPAPDRGEGQSKNARQRPPHHTKIAAPGSCLVQYKPPRGRDVYIRLSPPQLEMLQALRPAPVSRITLAKRRPRLGLSGPQYIERLRRKGLHIETAWHTDTDRDGRRVRFVEYHLLGTVQGVIHGV